jgi:hypothetical protein
MNTDIEQLLRDGMERFTAGVTAPDGLARGAIRLHRRRVAIRRTAVGGGIAVAAAVAVVLFSVAGVAAQTGPRPAHARDAAYVTNRVKIAVSSQNLVAVGHTLVAGEANVTYTYGSYYNWVQYWPTTDNRDRIVNGQRQWDFPPADRGKPITATGTTLVDGKLNWAYVTYDDSRYSVSPLQDSWNSQLPKSACTTTARLEMGGLPVLGVSWPQFIGSTLRCGTATVTGKARINGVLTTQITGKPVTVRLSADYAKYISAKWATVQWKMYVNSATYLPVRMYGSTRTYGGKAGNQVSSGRTDVTWLPPTPANVAKALVTIPAGFGKYTGPVDDQ